MSGTVFEVDLELFRGLNSLWKFGTGLKLENQYPEAQALQKPSPKFPGIGPTYNLDKVM